MLVRLLAVALLLAGCTAPAEVGDDPNESDGFGFQDRDGEDVPAATCPRLSFAPEEEATRVGDAVRFVVRVENCGETPIATTSDCYQAVPGLSVDIGLPEGPRATLDPSDVAVPANGAWECVRAPAQATIPAGGSVQHAFTWDGRVEPFCPDRTGDSVGCEGTRPATPGAYEAAVSFSWGAESRHALATLVLVEPDTARVPVIVVNGTYEASRESDQPQLPARGEGCPDFRVTRAPWTATALRPEGPPVRAVVVREFPEGGFGSFGPEALALPRNGTLAIMSVLEPGRVLGVLEDTPEGILFAGKVVSAEPTPLASAYETTWEGESYRVAETIHVHLAGEAYLFPAATPQGC